MNDALKALADMPQPPTYLHIENAQLKQANAQMQAVLGQHGVQVLNDFVNGLGVMLNAAQQGDPNAQAMLKALADGIKRAQDGASPITIVRG